MKKLVFLLSALMLAGCASTKPAVTHVPTPIPCPAASSAPGYPELPIKNLEPQSSPDVVARSYEQSIVLLRGHVSALSIILDACK